MATKTEICNLAISHLGTGKEIQDFDTDRSEEGDACRRYYQILLEATLRDFAWPFATKIAALNLIEESPNDEWAYSYRYPSDCLKARRILSGIRNDSRQTRVPYKILKDEAGRIIYTDQINANLEYTILVEDTSYYTPDFILALSWRLASYLAPRLTQGDPYGLRNSSMQMYEAEISRARAASVNEQQDEEKPNSEFDRVRPSDYERSRD